LLRLVACADGDSSEGRWILDDGTRVHFFTESHSPPGKDTIKHFVVTQGDVSNDFPFAQWHAGYSHVELYMSPDSAVVWIVYSENGDRKHVGCSYDLIRKSFVDEHGDHPSQVGLTTGRLIPESQRNPSWVSSRRTSR